LWDGLPTAPYIEKRYSAMTQPFPRCRIVPLPQDRVSLQVDGTQRLAWHFGSRYERPFFFPFVGPSGSFLTRMGHPGAPNHDHHRSVWFAHYKVLGIDFWSNRTAARIRQKQWLAYQDGDDEAIMAVRLGWYDGHDPQELLEQDLIAAIRPGPGGETLLELQSTFRPRAESLEFGKTNFGFLAVRVAKSISAHFGRGRLTDSHGRTGEPAIFGKSAAWMDYSGPVPGNDVTTFDRGPLASSPKKDNARSDAAALQIEGITYHDHPTNPGSPTHWHVRSDGWMGASVCFGQPVITTRARPLLLRYLLHAHSGPVDSVRTERIHRDFAARAPFTVRRAQIKHTQYTVAREDLRSSRPGKK